MWSSMVRTGVSVGIGDCEGEVASLWVDKVVRLDVRGRVPSLGSAEWSELVGDLILGGPFTTFS